MRIKTVLHSPCSRWPGFIDISREPVAQSSSGDSLAAIWVVGWGGKDPYAEGPTIGSFSDDAREAADLAENNSRNLLAPVFDQSQYRARPRVRLQEN